MSRGNPSRPRPNPRQAAAAQIKEEETRLEL
jgi:hypothetical protein